MIDFAAIAKQFAMLIPFLLLCISNEKTNLKKPIRYKQFLMPVAALILCIVAMCLLSHIYNLALKVLTDLHKWIRMLSALLPGTLSGMIQNLAGMVENSFKSINLNFWAFYLANAGMLLAYVVVKKVILLFMKGLFKDGNLFQKVAGLFYEYDEDSGNWTLIPQFSQARTFLRTLYITAAVLGAAGVLVSSWLYLKELLTAIYYPVFSVIILGEMYFLLDGLTLKEQKGNDVQGEEEDAAHVSNYSAMRGILRKLFPDKLGAENTTVSDMLTGASTNDELLVKLEESDDVGLSTYGHFMRNKSMDGLELDFNYLTSGQHLLTGQSVLFNNPFYYDLLPYVFFPMNRTLLRHKKILVILGRHGAEADIENWCRDGFASVTNIPTMWSIGVLTDKQQDLDVGIITRSSVHDLKMHEANREFFDEVEFVVLVEPSRLVTTAQVGLNSLVRHCRRKQKQLVFCSADKNCDGLLDALSHILMTSLREVAATNHHKGASSYMIWEADGEHLQHRMLPNLSRYLGMGTELSFAALKNQIPQTQWYGGEAFPVVDIQWIAKQYYYDLLRYADLPVNQENMDRAFRVSADMWSAGVKPNQYITVEDESFNMFEVKRAFSTRATDQGFINVICSDYLLKDYMAANDTIFNADPKAIPYITADYARTPRNVVLRLCLRMSVGLVSEEDIRRELSMAGLETAEPAVSLWQEICKNCGYAGATDVDLDGNTVLRCRTTGEDVVFTSDVLVLKRRFSMESGKMENMYCITSGRFIHLILDSLKPAEYVAEDENGQRQYLGTELQGHVFQKYLPGQFFTFGGKYYEMLRVTSDGQVMVRRASEHIDGRPSYRQVRNYIISNCTDSTVMGECRDMGAIRITRQYADIQVQTPAYYRMKRYHDFSTGARVAINGVPERVYTRKALLRIDFSPELALPEGTLPTLAVLINEVLRTLFAENQDYLVAVCPGEAQVPNTYSLSGGEGSAIYLIEDSQMDIGLLDAAERNLDRIFNIICDYLQWHEETLAAEEKKPEPAPKAPETEEPPAEEPGKKPGFIKRIGKGIADFFRKIGETLKKLFGGKKKPEQPEEPAEPTADGSTPESGDAPVAEAPVAEAPVEDSGEDTAAESVAMFNTGAEAAGEEAPEAGESEAGVETTEGADGDTVGYEPEQVIDPSNTKSFRRLPYKQRCYLRYGSDEIGATLQLAAVRDLLVALGHDNNALTQARKGKDVAKLVEQSFVPNREGVHYCDFCGCELTGMDYDILGDGRERCTACGRTAIKDLDSFVQLHDAVLRNMKLFFGVKINAPVRVQMVNSKKLHRQLGKTFIPTGKADGRVLGVAIKDRNGYTILVENGAPKLQSTMTMVHEMTHIWQYLNWNARNIKKTYGADELEVYEGMAKWVEIQYTYLLNETATAKREELITRHRDDPYGHGFVKYADKYPLTVGPRTGEPTPFDNPQKPL